MYTHPRTQIDPVCNRVLTRTPTRASSPWTLMRRRFLAAVPDAQRPAVESILSQPHRGGNGLRAWIASLTHERSHLPEVLPPELIQVYLDDPLALGLHDCADCGVAIPVRLSWDRPEGTPDIIYFPRCPCCGGQTGLYAHWMHQEKSFDSRISGVSSSARWASLLHK